MLRAPNPPLNDAYFYFFLNHYEWVNPNPPNPDDKPHTTVIYRIKYDSNPANIHGLGSTREVLDVNNTWYPNSGVITIGPTFGSPAGQVPSGRSTMGFAFGSGDLFFDPRSGGNRWFHVFSDNYQLWSQESTTSSLFSQWIGSTRNGSPLPDEAYQTTVLVHNLDPLLGDTQKRKYGVAVWYGDAANPTTGTNKKTYVWVPGHQSDCPDHIGVGLFVSELTY